jgi:hypothetical protein
LIIIAADMKTQLNTSPIYTQGIESSQVSNMDMDLEGMKQACQIFRDNIYTDKILAVVREWVSNAVDEHLKHQIKQPVQTGIKEDRFFVRDFAKGLDDNGIRNVFGKYFRSTKSNSDQPIGGFGVGAKAGHCYQDVFYVTSFHNGTKTVYSCILGGDDSGASIGQVIEMSQEPTNESGLLVEVDIVTIKYSNDKETFLRYARAMANNATLAKVQVMDDHGRIIKSNSKKLILEKDGIHFYSFGEDSENITDEYIITMGGVKYNTPNSFKEFAFEEYCRPVTAIQIDVPVGFFEVPISREFFRETAKFTNGIAKCEKALTEFINQQKESIGNLALSELCIDKKNKSDFFVFKNSAFAPAKVALALNKISFAEIDNDPLFEDKGKKFVAIVSNSYHHRNGQIERLNSWCKANAKSIFFVRKEDAHYISESIAQYQVDSDLVFKPVASLFPKQKGGAYSDGKFSVYKRGRGRGRDSSFRASALELHNLYWNVTHTVDEARDFLAQISQSDSLTKLSEIVVSNSGFESRYGFTSVSLRKDLAALGYWMAADQTTRDRLVELRKIYNDAQNARSKMNNRYIACKNLLTNKTQNIILRNLENSRLSKRMDSIEKIIEQLKNNNNELVSIFTKSALSSYYFTPSRSDIRKFIKAAK